MDEILDFIRDVGDDLNGFAQIFATTFLADDGFVNLSGGEVVHLVHPGGDETFVVTQIEVGFRAVIGHENFTVLEWTHGSRIHIDVWVQFDHGNFKAPGLEDGGKRRSGNPLAKG